MNLNISIKTVTIETSHDGSCRPYDREEDVSDKNKLERHEIPVPVL